MKKKFFKRRIKTVMGIVLCVSMLLQPLSAAALEDGTTPAGESSAGELIKESKTETVQETPEETQSGAADTEADESGNGTDAEAPESTTPEESVPEDTVPATNPAETTDTPEETESGDEAALESAELYDVRKPQIAYATHVQTYGWLDMVSDGVSSGTTGEAKRLESLVIKLGNTPVSGGVEYRTHVQTFGWLDWVSDGAESGTTGLAKRLEAIQIRLTGEMANKYDVYYRVHCQTFDWTGWAKNGAPCGSMGYAKRLEAIQIVLVEKGGAAPGKTTDTYVEDLKVTYQTHVQTFGWQAETSNGVANGTTGLAKRLEGIKIRLENHFLTEGSIEYRTHVQTFGWQDWVKEGELAGTTGLAKRLEAIEIRLTGDMEKKYDIYYRVHCQTFGWTGWAKNGAPCGSEGYYKRLEAIEIVLVGKGGAAPGSVANTYYKPELWGVDVSAWQGSINWQKAKADGVEFAMLRITQKNTGSTGGTLMEDHYFRKNAQGALANGIPIGGYVYCYASTPEEARAEAEFAVSLLRGYPVTLPVVFDLEEEEHMTTAAKLNNMAMAQEFCSVMRAAGYKTMVYGSPSKLKRVFDYDRIASAYEIWLARYRWSDDVLQFNDSATRAMVKNTGYEGGNWTGLTNVQMWQYTERGRVNGIPGNVDLDLSYKLY